MIGLIEKLKGIYISNLGNGGIIVDVNGVGYGVELPLSDLCAIGEMGSTIELWIHTHVREDIIKLYGFSTQSSRTCFDILMSVNGVGPKAALAILATLNISQLHNAIATANINILTKVPGIGPKLAERMMVELKSKLKLLSQLTHTENHRKGAISQQQSDLFTNGNDTLQPIDNSLVYDDVQSALLNLGFKDKYIQTTIDKHMQLQKTWTFSHLLKSCLLDLSPKTASNIERTSDN